VWHADPLCKDPRFSHVHAKVRWGLFRRHTRRLAKIMRFLPFLIVFMSAFLLLVQAEDGDFSVADPFDGLAEIQGQWDNKEWFIRRCAYCRAKCCSQTSARPPITKGQGAVQLMHWHSCNYCTSRGCCIGVPVVPANVKTATNAPPPSTRVVLVTITSTCPATTPTRTSTMTEIVTMRVRGNDVTKTITSRSTRTKLTTLTLWQ